ncbi:uncharacterized protein [Triticum aestivum]|uniref:uncharacterized protein n=1 Tax=Triticum aestivum TaxID=4565 RepID=UPI001D02557A|nr:uncharacterized protein LOC123129684 [Triticum aestivum]
MAGDLAAAASPAAKNKTKFSTLPDGSVVAPATPAILTTSVIDLNVTPEYSGAGQPSDGRQRKQPRSIPTTNLAGACKLFDDIPLPAPTVDDPEYAAFMENVIFEGRDCPKFKDQYAARKKKGGKADVAKEGDLLKRPWGKTNSKADEKRDASSMALQATLEGRMSQKEVGEERRSNGKDEQMKIYLELQTKKLDMEEAMKRMKLDIEEAAQLKNLVIEATNADTKAKEVALAIISIGKTNVSPERKAWFTNRQKEMLTSVPATGFVAGVKLGGDHSRQTNPQSTASIQIHLHATSIYLLPICLLSQRHSPRPRADQASRPRRRWATPDQQDYGLPLPPPLYFSSCSPDLSHDLPLSLFFISYRSLSPWSTLAGAPSTPRWPDPARKQADPFILVELRLPFPSLRRAPSSLSSCPASASSRLSLCALKTSEPPPALTRCFEDEDAQRPAPESTPLHRLLPRLGPAPSLPSPRRSLCAGPPQPRWSHAGTNKDAAPWNLLCLELLHLHPPPSSRPAVFASLPSSPASSSAAAALLPVVQTTEDARSCPASRPVQERAHLPRLHTPSFDPTRPRCDRPMATSFL